MKKLFCSLFLIGVVGMMTVSAGNVKVEQVATSYAQCIPAQSKDVYYYIPNDTVKYRPWDNITASKPAILVASKTKVELWNPNNLISQCGDWSTIGNITPGGRQQTLALHNFDGCVFTKPNYSKAQDPNKLDAQIHYSVAFWTLNDTSPNKATASFAYTTKAKFDQSPREYTCYPSGQKVAKPADCPKATVKYQKVNGDAEYHNGECLNYRVFWCGDGLVNRPDGSTEYNNGTANEQCDPNDPNKTGWGNGGCDTSCKPINNPEPVCSSTYHNTTTYNTNFPTPRMQQTAPLCTQGKVGEFVFDATTGKYTWKCNGEAWTTPVQCQAQDLRCGDGTKNGSEQCDPKDLNKSGWGNGGCDTSCKPINNPEPACHSDYNGKTLENLTAGNHLCNPGTMTNFKLEGNTWTWKCNGEAGTTPADCSANKKPKPEAPACHSDYNGKTLENLTAGNHLCNPGTMTNFKLEGNTWTWKCNGEAGTTPADCSANKKEEAPIYDLALTKKLADKKSSYKPGDDIFIIFTIYNQGNREATNIQLTDYIPEGLEVADSMWNDVGNTSIYFFTDTIAPGMSAEVYMKATIKPDFKGRKIVNKAEISKDNSGDYNTTDKDSTPNNNPNDDCYTGDDKHIITGNGKAATAGNCTDATDEDDHDGVSLAVDQPTPPVDPITYDLALTKTITNKKASYKAGDELEFTFTIYNQGNKDARNIQITDYFPSDLELLDSSWTLVGGKATKTLTDTIAPNSHKSLTMKVKIKPDFKGSKIVNKAEISKDNSGDYNTTDKDSTPNNNPNDDCYTGDDKHIITGNGKAATVGNCTDATDEDDHDGVCIKVDAKPEIKKNLTGDPNHRYKIGEFVGFKMPFKNTTPNTLQKVSIKDFLPLNLEYVSSEIQGVSPIMSGLSVKSGVTVLEYSGFNLAPNQEGYLLFTGRVKVDHLPERINTVGIYVNDLLVESDTESYKITHPNLMIEKLVDKKVVNSGDVVTFTLNVRVLSGAYDELKVVDTLPKGLVYVENTQKLTNSTTNTTITDFTTGKNTNNLDTLNWKLAFADTIKAGQTFQLQFQAKLLETSNGKYTNTACVEDPKTPHDPICDLEDVTPRDPKGDLSIKKYVNTVWADAGREDVLMTGFAKGQTAFFTLEIRDAKQAITGFTVSDVVEGNLEYLNSTDLLNNAFTGLYLRAGANTDPYSYQTTLKTEKIAGNKTRLQWKVAMTQGSFLPGDVYKIQFKAKVNGDQKNIGTVEYSTPNTPNGKSEDDASVKTNEVWLTIKKYVSDRIDGNWQDDSLTLANGKTAYFKLVIWGATNSLTGFKITDKVENNLKYLDSTDLANNAYTGIINFGANNPTKPSYTLTPKATGTHPTDLEWQLDMGTAFFMPGDELVIIFKAQKNGDQTNIAHLYYPKRDGTTGHAQDPARVTTPSSGGGWGWWWGWGWWGWSGGWYSPSCGNGRKDGNEICDLGSSKTVGSDWKLFTSTEEYNTAYAGYTCTNTCRLEKDGSKLAPQCFNLQNGSISIMKGEVLPFYRNMEAQAGKATRAEKTAWLRKHFVFACGDTNDLGKIALNAMQCSFKVYGPAKDNGNEIYSFTAPCALSLKAWLNSNNDLYPRLSSYVGQNKE